MPKTPSIAHGLHLDSLLAHGGGGFDAATGAVVPPIQTATTFVRDESYELINPGHIYSRDDNALYKKTEKLIAALEGGEDSRLFASGMAAVAAVARIVKPGGTLLVQSGIYWGTTLFLRKLCARNKIALVEADASDLQAFQDEMAVTRPDLVWLEVPSNPFLKVADIKSIASQCKDVDAVLAVDATAATPLILKPLSLGADLVMHSATKALNGHSDLLGGVVTTNDAGSEAWAFLTEERKLAGAVLGSFETWLLLRGMRTLGLRVERMNSTAQAFAEHFEKHPNVEVVLYPGVESHPHHELAKSQMTGGFGSLMSILVKGGKSEALKVTGALALFQRATSLGGTESLVEHRYTIEGEGSGIPENLLRLSIGIENCDDLIADMDQALAAT
ncbi:Cystathionine gamma-synthase [Stappia aggregata IAM 12614]|uniref:Cystathionine gamma-synthase n=1 Tax=Roseibium aggregatum (strain ATCC 25650 / DSM 13394 / JCM 20685 / NBRC 16684 / NCIMB 2208 / IAM 12614 / B1) TaxID=384765 RepID=A0NTX3_ROSAI|nr:aminotransferase class V-fold PLP-dependent enzyme [Roseibium aggregatum]EAV43882.1 Cystathionine gamma-synthase [Stappia aggregata IAM 12614] [Roseibium aggregatum IAM 12614]